MITELFKPAEGIEEAFQASMAIKDIRLISDHVLIANIKPATQTAGGLWIPESAQREACDIYQADVVAASPYWVDENGQERCAVVGAGDRVLFYFLAGVAGITNWPDSNHQIISSEHIQCIIRPDGWIQALGHRVAVRQVDTSVATIGGFMVPDAYQKKPCEGIAVSIGARVLCDLKVGERVTFFDGAGTEMMSPDGPLLLMPEEDLLTVLED